MPPAAFVDDRVLGHEGVQPERVDALGLHLARLGARSTLVALMHRADDDVSKIVDEVTEAPPLRRFGTDVEQTVWRIADADATTGSASDRSTGRGCTSPTDTIARWHRSICGSERDGRRIRACPWSSSPTTSCGCSPSIVGSLGPLPMSTDELLAALRERLAVEEVDGRPQERGTFGLYAGGRWFRLVPPTTEERGVGSLDVSVLHRDVLEPIFGFGSAGDPGLEFVSDAVPLEELTGRVDADGGAAFTLSPPTFDQFVDVADRHEQMPAKATYFDPKPQTGLFLRIEEGEADPPSDLSG